MIQRRNDCGRERDFQEIKYPVEYHIKLKNRFFRELPAIKTAKKFPNWRKISKKNAAGRYCNEIRLSALVKEAFKK